MANVFSMRTFGSSETFVGYLASGHTFVEHFDIRDLVALVVDEYVRFDGGNILGYFFHLCSSQFLHFHGRLVAWQFLTEKLKKQEAPKLHWPVCQTQLHKCRNAQICSVCGKFPLALYCRRNKANYSWKVV